MLTGILLKIASAFSFSLMSAMVKAEAGAFPVAQLIFFRSFFAMVVLLIWLVIRGEFPGALATQQVMGHFRRAILGTCGMFSGFMSLFYLPLAEATAIGFVSPLITVALAAVFLGETVRVYRWSAVAIGFVGIVVMLSEHLFGSAPATDARSIGLAFALGGACFSAMSTIQIRMLAHTESTGAIVFYFSLATTLVSGALMLIAPFWPETLPGAHAMRGQLWIQPTHWTAWASLVGLGVFGGFGQILMTASFRYADASIIACFDYTSMIWAVLLSLAFFHEGPTVQVIAGGLIVSGAGLFVIWREHRLGLIKRAVRKAGPNRPV